MLNDLLVQYPKVNLACYLAFLETNTWCDYNCRGFLRLTTYNLTTLSYSPPSDGGDIAGERRLEIGERNLDGFSLTGLEKEKVFPPSRGFGTFSSWIGGEEFFFR